MIRYAQQKAARLAERCRDYAQSPTEANLERLEKGCVAFLELTHPRGPTLDEPGKIGPCESATMDDVL